MLSCLCGELSSGAYQRDNRNLSSSLIVPSGGSKDSDYFVVDALNGKAVVNFDSGESWSNTMQPNKAYDEVIEFIASSSPQNVIAFRPSPEVKARVAELIFREKTEGLPEDEKSELHHFLQIEHLMRLAKARAHHYLANV